MDPALPSRPPSVPSIAAFARDRHGANAVEFALVAPMFLSLLFGIFAFGQIVYVQNGLQQLAAEAARASVGGLTDPERDRLARQYVAANLGTYASLDTARLQVAVTPTQTVTEVALTYDLADALAYRFAGFVPLPDPSIRRAAAIQRGGY